MKSKTIIKGILIAFSLLNVIIFLGFIFLLEIFLNYKYYFYKISPTNLEPIIQKTIKEGEYCSGSLYPSHSIFYDIPVKICFVNIDNKQIEINLEPKATNDIEYIFFKGEIDSQLALDINGFLFFLERNCNKVASKYHFVCKLNKNLKRVGEEGTKFYTILIMVMFNFVLLASWLKSRRDSIIKFEREVINKMFLILFLGMNLSMWGIFTFYTIPNLFISYLIFAGLFILFISLGVFISVFPIKFL